MQHYRRIRRRTIPNLHDTITRLRALTASAEPQSTASGRLQDFDEFGANPGDLRAKAYVPASFVKGAPLVVVLHGCTQSAQSYDHHSGWSAAADAHGFALLFPEQARTNNFNLCFNWYQDEDAKRGSGESLSIRNMVAAILDRSGADPSRVFVTGLSAGGAMTAVMLANYPEIFAGGGIIAGLPFGIANSVPQAFDRMRGHGGPTGKALSALVRAASDHRGPWPILSIWHGSGDRIVDQSNARALIEQWGALHGVSQAPSMVDEVDGYPHRTWNDCNGRPVLEEYSITGMAHGTPLDTFDARSGEVAGAHMLEAGISSTQHLLRFWGVIDDKGVPVLARRPAGIDAPPTPSANDRRVSSEASHGIERTIESALRAAGLLK